MSDDLFSQGGELGWKALSRLVEVGVSTDIVQAVSLHVECIRRNVTLQRLMTAPDDHKLL
ncbi:hypothetical protein [Paraburkholderia phenoliruptrix]|uniref:hypothetical protein n=1 Tax=Paraburkholderia phenoliruptrix TaxID=252970 RepID=UPI0034CFAC98